MENTHRKPKDYRGYSSIKPVSMLPITDKLSHVDIADGSYIV